MKLIIVLLLCGLVGFCHGLSEETKKALLDIHNTARSKLATGQEAGSQKGNQVADMNAIYWSSELAATAQVWADSCSAAPHDTNDQRKTTNFPIVGQNEAPCNGDNNELSCSTTGANMWYTEVKNVLQGGNVYGGKTGHYTQMVWAKTNMMGCGFTQNSACPKKRVVCNYAEGGNIEGAKYATFGGAACGKCFINMPYCKAGLCVRSNEPGATNSATSAACKGSFSGGVCTCSNANTAGANCNLNCLDVAGTPTCQMLISMGYLQVQRTMMEHSCARSVTHCRINFHQAGSDANLKVNINAGLLKFQA